MCTLITAPGHGSDRSYLITWVGPNLGGVNLTPCRVLRQICVATPLARPSFRAKAADLDSYKENDAVHIWFQTAFGSAKAFEQERGCKSPSWLRAGSGIAKRLADGYLRAQTNAGAAALCSPTLKLTKVSLPAHACPPSV